MRYRLIRYRYAEVAQDAPPQSLEDLWGSRRRVMVARPQWRPPVDLYETEDRLIVKVEIAGLREEDFEITLYDDTLVVEGVRSWLLSDAARFHAMEVRYGPFRIEVPVLPNIDREQVSGPIRTRLSLCDLTENGGESMTADEKDGREDVKGTSLPDALSVLPLRDTVAFPMAVIPLLVGQERSVKLVEDAMRANRMIFLVAQKSVEARPAGPEDLYRMGTAAVIQQLLRAPDGTLRLVVQGLERVRIVDFARTEPYLVARIERAPEIIEEGVEVEAFIRAVRDLIQRLTPLIPELPDELSGAIQALTDLRQIVYLVATSVPISVAARQDLLEINSLPAKLRRLIELLQHEVAVRELGQKITRETEEEMSKAQRDYVLREQMKTIQRQLGEENPEQAEIEAFRRRLQEAPLPEEARKEAERELSGWSACRRPPRSMV
ncbi:MAG: LON peptidase substrate-binding domain-containing protein [Candidatus Manganitrophus sp.]|nr:MAG: LON peptidase substrate-binding domain-containing protein [Candidatus Manganitrophus sp.]